MKYFQNGADMQGSLDVNMIRKTYQGLGHKIHDRLEGRNYWLVYSNFKINSNSEKFIQHWE